MERYFLSHFPLLSTLTAETATLSRASAAACRGQNTGLGLFNRSFGAEPAAEGWHCRAGRCAARAAPVPGVPAPAPYRTANVPRRADAGQSVHLAGGRIQPQCAGDGRYDVLDTARR